MVLVLLVVALGAYVAQSAIDAIETAAICFNSISGGMCRCGHETLELVRRDGVALRNSECCGDPVVVVVS